jgi:hypothetical protein
MLQRWLINDYAKKMAVYPALAQCKKLTKGTTDDATQVADYAAQVADDA